MLPLIMLGRHQILKHIVPVLFLLGFTFGSDNHRSSVITTDYGFIDYANRIIICRGTAEIIEKKSSEGDLNLIEKNLKLSKGEARSRARVNLIDLIKLVNFDGRTVGELMISDPLIESRVQSLVGSAFQKGDVEYLEQNQVAVALALKMSGLAEILVDANGYLTEGIAESTYLMTRAVTPASERISGIIIDARNIYHIPAMVPKILNESQKLIYGPRHYTRSRSVNRGPIGYAHSLEDNNVKRRVGNSPIVVEAVNSDDTVNLMVNNIDAELIRDAEKKFGVLSNCKVLVLLK